MVYGHYIPDTVGNERFFVEGCNYCRMSTGGQHESNCPCRDVKVADRESKLLEIRDNSFIKYGEAWQRLAQM